MLKGFVFVEVRHIFSLLSDVCRLYVDRERSLLFTQELCPVSEKVKLCKLMGLGRREEKDDRGFFILCSGFRPRSLRLCRSLITRARPSRAFSIYCEKIRDCSQSNCTRRPSNSSVRVGLCRFRQSNQP